jgi:tetratricopeptide (TPR) repeat protein
MLKPKKKLVKKEIKQDTLVKLSSQATVFYYDHKKYVQYAVVALAVLGIAIYVMRKNRIESNEKATSDFAKVMAIYEAGASDPAQYKSAINGLPERGITGLKAIVENGSGSTAGETARFYLANAYYFTGQYEDALTQYDKYSGGSPMLKAAAYAGLAGCYEVKKDFAKAASAYERAAGAASGASNAPDYLSLSARCLGKAGEKEQAISLLKRIKKEFPTSTAAREADRYIAQFSA